MESYAEIFGNIMQKKVMIMPKRCQLDYVEICKVNKAFSLAFSSIQNTENLTPLCHTFDLLLPFVDRYFFVQCSFSIVSCPKLSNRALNRMRKTGHQKSQN